MRRFAGASLMVVFVSSIVLWMGCATTPVNVAEEPKYLYGTGIGKSRNEQMALDMAKANARLDIASQVQTTVEQSVEETDTGPRVVTKETTSGVILSGCEVIKEEVKQEEDLYRAYVEMRMPVEGASSGKS